MKKTSIIVFSILALTVPVLAANFILNPGFESGMSSWKDLYGAPTVITNAQKHLGTYSASKTVASVSGQDYWSQVYQDIALTAGQPVYGQMYVKTIFSPEATARAGVMIQYLNSSNAVIGTTLTSNGIGGNQAAWRLVEVSARTAPTGTVKARLSGYIWARLNDTISLNTKAYFDDGYLDKIYQAPRIPTALINPGFENGLNDWTDKYGTPATLDKTSKFAGIYAAKKTITSVSAQDYWSQIYQEIALAAGKKITASMYIKTNFNVTAQAVAGLQVEFLNASNAVLGTFTDTATGITNWTLQSVAATAPTGTTKVRLSGFVYAPQGNVPSTNGVAYFDNAALTIAP